MKTLVKNSRTLKAMAKKGLVQWPVDKGQKYVNENKMEFVFNKRSYFIKYLDGCFYPFVFLKS